VKNSIERMSQLRYELTTDKPFRAVDKTGDDHEMWNQSYQELLEKIGVQNCTWFKGPWLYAECYLYRRIREALLTCKTDLKYQDPFEEYKLDTYKHNQKSTHDLISSLCPLDENEKSDFNLLTNRFRVIMEALLWSNKNDLSLSSGNDVSSKLHNLIELLDSFKDKILCDNTTQVWTFLNELKQRKGSNEKPIRVDIVLDNCSIELVSDLILCDFLLRNEYVDLIYLHAKPYFWFISDVTKHDFDHLFKELQSSNSLVINRFLTRIKNALKAGKIILQHDDQFWNSPYSLHDMERVAPKLYSDLKTNSSLVFLKGDLNYRKLIGDLNWPFETPLINAIHTFKPTSLCAVRTIKADLIANIDTNLETNHNYASVINEFKDSTKWMNTGDYAIIQFVQIPN
jgi:hypothetical protein